MSEITKLLRYQAPADKEIASQRFNIAAQITGEAFVSSLSTGYSRKYMSVYNSSDSASGEVYIGPEGVTVDNGMVLEKGAWIDLPVSNSLDIYFVAGGAGCEIRIVELA